MKIMNFIYKIFGFEGDDVKVANKKKNTQKATYDLKVTQKLPDEIDGVKVYYPQTYEDCKDKIQLLKKEIPFFIDFRGCSMAERNKIVDYYTGVVDVIDAHIEIMDMDLYLFLPKGMEVERGD